MRARPLLSAVALLASAACTSLPKPVVAPGEARPAVAAGDAPGLTVWTPASSTGLVGGMGAGTYFSVDRDAYAAAFAVTRDGRLRVVWPASPGDDGVVRAGRSYSANASFAQYGTFMAGARNAVPYVFVIASDQRLDLSRFGSGSRWRYQVDLEDMGRWAEDALQTVAAAVLPDESASYAADFAFVPPRLTGGAQMLALNCGVRNVDARNYDYYRDLWAVVDPWDSYLGPVGFASWSFWPGGWFPYSGRGMMGLYADRASRATAAFWSGCPAFQGLSPFSLAYGLPQTLQRGAFYQPIGGVPAPGVPRDTTTRPGDSLRVRPSEVFGAPGTTRPGTDEAAAAARRERLRERIAAGREERRDREPGVGRERRVGELRRGTELRTERLSTVDVTALERRARALEMAELGIGANDRLSRRGERGERGDSFGGREAPGAGDRFRSGRAGSRGTSDGVVGRGRASSDGFGGRSSGMGEGRGAGMERGSARGDAGGGTSRGAEARGGGSAGGGESRGSSSGGSGEGGGARRP